MLSLKLSIYTLSTNTKVDIIYLSNIQYAKNSDSIRFVPYFNRQNHVKDKKISFKLDIACPTSIIQVSEYHTKFSFLVLSGFRNLRHLCLLHRLKINGFFNLSMWFLG